MLKTKVKICGITSLEDAQAAVAAGADAIGLVFYPPSSRYVTPVVAAQIVAGLGPFVMTVGLFVNEEPAVVKETLALTGLQLLQFHGDESEQYCRQFERPYIKALRMSPELDPAQAMAAYPQACGYLFDAWQADKFGGTGATFDWQRIVDLAGDNLILAGGLNPDNVAAAVQAVRPYAVDVSGGVELAPGKKDHLALKAFISAAKRGKSG
ncbi:MAG: phosphoribosylanthranilate isomerase [Gammaproteobacteria bacterium]|nr:phosphoribosylanthranilate isomerase [Gammaproteobacteria bacterium]MBQ0840239.1 phosphoribosylanthranilate isomerase [Gammaproteobacteria bacterium]